MCATRAIKVKKEKENAKCYLLQIWIHRQEDIVKIAKQNTKAVLLSMQNSELQLRTT